MVSSVNKMLITSVINNDDEQNYWVKNNVQFFNHLRGTGNNTIIDFVSPRKQEWAEVNHTSREKL